jgi:hypothetical protein
MNSSMLEIKRSFLLFFLIISLNHCIAFKENSLDPNSGFSLLNLLRLIDSSRFSQKTPTIVLLTEITENLTTKKIGLYAINPETNVLRWKIESLYTYTGAGTDSDYQFYITADQKGTGFAVVRHVQSLDFAIQKFNTNTGALSTIKVITSLLASQQLAGIQYSASKKKIFVAINGWSTPSLLYVFNSDSLELESTIPIVTTNSNATHSNNRGELLLDESKSRIFYTRIEKPLSAGTVFFYNTLISTSAPYELLNPFPNYSNTAFFSTADTSTVPSAYSLLYDSTEKIYRFSIAIAGDQSIRSFSGDSGYLSTTTLTGANVGTFYNGIKQVLQDEKRSRIYHIFLNSTQYALHSYNRSTGAQVGNSLILNPSTTSGEGTFALAKGGDRLFFPVSDPGTPVNQVTCNISYVDLDSMTVTAMTPLVDYTSSAADSCTGKRIIYFE